MKAMVIVLGFLNTALMGALSDEGIAPASLMVFESSLSQDFPRDLLLDLLEQKVPKGEWSGSDFIRFEKGSERRVFVSEKSKELRAQAACAHDIKFFLENRSIDIPQDCLLDQKNFMVDVYDVWQQDIYRLLAKCNEYLLPFEQAAIASGNCSQDVRFKISYLIQRKYSHRPFDCPEQDIDLLIAKLHQAEELTSEEIDFITRELGISMSPEEMADFSVLARVLGKDDSLELLETIQEDEIRQKLADRREKMLLWLYPCLRIKINTVPRVKRRTCLGCTVS